MGEPTSQLLLLQYSREIYALPSGCLREVTRFRPFTVVPGAPPVLPGVISQRGGIIPVVDLRSLLSLPDQALTRAARLVIVRQADIEFALLAEVVLDLIQVAADAIQPLPPGIEPQRARLLAGVVAVEQHMVAVLDPGALIAALREA